jgi:hypothetical protein
VNESEQRDAVLVNEVLDCMIVINVGLSLEYCSQFHDIVLHLIRLDGLAEDGDRWGSMHLLRAFRTLTCRKATCSHTLQGEF